MVNFVRKDDGVANGLNILFQLYSHCLHSMLRSLIQIVKYFLLCLRLCVCVCARAHVCVCVCVCVIHSWTRQRQIHFQSCTVSQSKTCKWKDAKPVQVISRSLTWPSRWRASFFAELGELEGDWLFRHLAECPIWWCRWLKVEHRAANYV